MPFARRPLMRAALVGGTAYAAGKHVQSSREDQAAAANPSTSPAASPPVSSATGTKTDDGRVDALAKLKDLRDAGVLTPAEFDAEKRRILDHS